MEAKPELKYIFSNVNEWLKFAEAKHAGLAVLNIGVIIGISSSYQNILLSIPKAVLLISLTSLGLSVFLSIVSQFPVLNNSYYQKKKIRNPNLYFFGHLSHFDVDGFHDELKTVHEGYVPTKLDNDLVNQILVNARITKVKFLLFRYASYFTIFGLGVLGLSSIINIL